MDNLWGGAIVDDGSSVVAAREEECPARRVRHRPHLVRVPAAQKIVLHVPKSDISPIRKRQLS